MQLSPLQRVKFLGAGHNVLMVKASKKVHESLVKIHFNPWQTFFQPHETAAKKEIADFAKQLRKRATSP